MGVIAIWAVLFYFGVVTPVSIKQMTKAQKISMMEALWKDLSLDSGYVSPSWHEKVLTETDSKVTKGFQSPVAWESVHKKLRSLLK